MPATPAATTVLHYLGYDEDRGGTVSVVRSLAATGRFDCVLGMNRGAVQRAAPALTMLELPHVDGERIDPRNAWRACAVAREVRKWLRAGPRRVFHGHSRAGLLVALWLGAMGERRAVASVHCYGRRRGFYRWAARRLGERIVWLTPEMKRYYGVGAVDWNGCIPNSLAAKPRAARLRPVAAGRLTIGGAGMLVGWKRWRLMLEAMALLPDAVRGRIEFRHVGAPGHTAESTACARELLTTTKRLDLESQVQWLGWQPSTQPLLEQVDALLVASLLEPFSMSALEALFAGVPVIAADEGGPRDFVREGASGWFFRSGDPRDLARVLALLLETDALARVDIRPQDLARFDATAVGGQWESVYARLAGSGD
ncbi:MAG TPA: glycosyltransferase family 4 protein [Opitutus sp.]|nr:glycosyltransferase family 4 protein [Opitutus sp.]